MFTPKILKKLLIPGTAAAVAIKADLGPKTGTTRELCRPSELPIYESDVCNSIRIESDDSPNTVLEEQIRELRRELWVWYDKYKGYRQTVVETVETGKAHSSFLLEYLKEESNYFPRIGAVSLGGLTGLIFGLRGGWIRKITYAMTGSSAMAALCYPRETSKLAHEGLTYAKKCVAITYNFIYGVKPDTSTKLVQEKGTKNQNEKTIESVEDTANQAQQGATSKQDDLTIRAIRDQSNPEDRDLYTTRTRK